MPPQGGYGVTLGGMTTPDGVPLASWGQRAGAYLLDSLILGLVSTVLGGYFLYRFFQWYLAVLIMKFLLLYGTGLPFVLASWLYVAYVVGLLIQR